MSTQNFRKNNRTSRVLCLMRATGRKTQYLAETVMERITVKYYTHILYILLGASIIYRVKIVLFLVYLEIIRELQYFCQFYNLKLIGGITERIFAESDTKNEINFRKKWVIND